MASTCSPSSLQLRLAMNCNNYKVYPSILIPSRTRTRDFCFRMLCASQNEKRIERRRNGSWLIACGSTADSFAGWSDSDDGDQPAESQKKWLGGAVAAGVAGVVLVAGLTFAALSLSKRSVTRPTQQMEPLTVQQEASLDYVGEDDNREYGKSEESSSKVNDGSLERNLDFSSPPPEVNEAHGDNEPGEKNEASSAGDVEYSSSEDTTKNASVQEDLHSGSVLDDNPIASEGDHSSSELEKNLFHSEPIDLSKNADLNFEHDEGLTETRVGEDSGPPLDSSVSGVHEPNGHVAENISVSSQLHSIVEPQTIAKGDTDTVTNDNLDLGKEQVLTEGDDSSFMEANNINEMVSSETTSKPALAFSFDNEQEKIGNKTSSLPTFGGSFSSAGIPAPSVASEALQALPGKVLIPAVVDQVQGQALAALQALKVIGADVQPSDLCTRREYARWLVAASGALSRNTMSKVYPAMYIEDVTELAFDDITPNDPDFSFIQGLAEAGLISSKLSSRDLLSASDEFQGPFYFSPESPLSRQDLVSWKMALEKRELPEPDKKILYQLSGFRDIDKINPDAWPALISDLSGGDQGIISLAFGCTRLFQPNKPVTKAQAAVALATGEAADIVSEELARIEAESIAENAVSAHNALVAEVERDVNASFEKELFVEREKISAVEKMAEEARQELERLRAEREKDNLVLMKERAAIESEMEVLSRLRREMEEQLQSLMGDKVEISYEKERISKLQQESENEKQEISRLQYELEVERKALSMARAWAEDEAKRAQEQAKALEEARYHWERQGIKVVVDSDLREESSGGVTWLNAGKQYSVERTVNRAENLVDKLKLMANEVRGKSREVINKIMQKVLIFISTLKEWISEVGTRAKELKDVTILKAEGSMHELQRRTNEFSLAVKEKAAGSIQEFQQSTSEIGLTVKEGAKRVAGDCREGVEKLTQKFKS